MSPVESPHLTTYEKLQPPMPGLDLVMDYAGSHPGKLATILALSTFDPGEYATSIELVRRMNALQGEAPGWDFTSSHTVPFSYCKKSLYKAGLVEFATKPSIQKGKTAEGVRLNGFGRWAGLVVAGALLPLEIDSPVGSLQEAMGSAQQQRAKNNDEPSRLAMYRELLSRPGGVASITELGEKSKLGRGTVVNSVQELCRIGILECNDRHEPSSRNFMLTEPPDTLRAYFSRMNPDTRLAVEAGLALKGEGHKQVTGADILTAATRLRPDADLNKVWDMLLAWIRNHDRERSLPFINEIPLTNDRRIRTQVRISDIWQPFLADLLGVRDLLIAEGAEAEAFRAAALLRARELADPALSPGVLARILARAQGESRFVAPQRDEDWTEIIHRHVPVEGMSATELHDILSNFHGRQMSYQKFRRRLGGIARLIITERQGIGRARAALGFVTRRTYRFSEDWNNKARCRGGREDPELFFPTGTEGPAIEQAEKAKRICNGCPVRLACLKTALNRDEQFGVWGGVWMEKQKEELPREERDWLDTTVTIDTQEKTA